MSADIAAIKQMLADGDDHEIKQSAEASSDHIRNIAIMFLLFKLMNSQFAPSISRLIYKGYPALSKALKVEWDSRFTSSFHSILVSALGLACFCFDKSLRADCIDNASYFICFLLCIIMAYQLHDTFLVIRYFNVFKDYWMIVHHMFVLLCSFFCVFKGIFPYFIMYRLLSEISTPFVNFRWFLSTAGIPKKSKLYISTGVFMIVSFFASRLLPLPHFWTRVYQTCFSSRSSTDCFGYQYVLFVSGVSMDILNCLWFKKMLHGAYSLLREKTQRLTAPSDTTSPYDTTTYSETKPVAASTLKVKSS